jgi:hypothetical protein
MISIDLEVQTNDFWWPLGLDKLNPYFGGFWKTSQLDYWLVL